MAKTLRNRYSKSLEGLNAQGFFSKTGVSQAATSATTLKGFIGSAAEGEIAVFTEANAVHTGALVAGSKYFIGQIVDGELKRSTLFTAGSIETQATAFSAPVLQKTAIGWNGTSGDLNINVVGGLQEFVLRINETTPATQPFPTVEGRAVVRSGSPTDYDIASDIVKDLMGNYDLEQNGDEIGFTAHIITQAASVAIGTGVAVNGIAVKGTKSVTVDGTGTGSLSVGQLVKFAAAGANASVPTYQIAAINGAVITLDRALIANVANNVAVTEVDFDAGNAAKDSVGIVIEGIAEDVTFSVGASEDLASATVTSLVDWKQGSGAAWQVAAMEKETQVFAGETTQNMPFREDYGRPASFVNEDAVVGTITNQYSLWFIKTLNTTPSMAVPNENVSTFGYIIVGVTDQANSGLASQLATQFGTPA